MPKAQQDGRHSNADAGEFVQADSVTVAGDDPDQFLGSAEADPEPDPDDETGEDAGEDGDGDDPDDPADDDDESDPDPEPVRGPGGRFAPRG